MAIFLTGIQQVLTELEACLLIFSVCEEILLGLKEMSLWEDLQQVISINLFLFSS